MALTNQQDIPNKPEVREPWTIRRLFPFAVIASTISKAFVNPFDILLGFTIFVIGIGELFNRRASWEFYALAVIVLLVTLFEKHAEILLNKKEGGKLPPPIEKE